MKLWYLSHRRPAKAQAGLPIRAVSPEPSLFAHINYEVDEGARPKFRHLAPLDGCAIVFTEDEKYHNLMTWLIFIKQNGIALLEWDFFSIVDT